jgi:phage gp36-like protein
MPWIALTEAHLLEALTSLELSSLRTVQLAEGQADPLPDVLARATSEVQGYVGVRYQVGQAGTVPDQLLSSAIAIARWRLIGRLPARQLATDSRRKDYEDAMEQLRDVAAGKFALSVATEPADDQPRPPATGRWGSSKSIFQPDSTS